MKKILLSAIVAIFGFSASAQDAIFQFVDAAGNDVSGTTVVASAHESVFGGLEAASGVSVKNVANETYHCQLSYSIQALDHGSAQICFNLQCEDFNTASEEGVFSVYQGGKTNEFKAIKAGKSASLMDHWAPADGINEGECVIVYKTNVFKGSEVDGKVTYNFVGEGPSVTVRYTLGEAGIEGVVADKTVVSTSYYDMCGCKVATPSAGLYIKQVVYADGSVENVKLLVK